MGLIAGFDTMRRRGILPLNGITGGDGK